MSVKKISIFASGGGSNAQKIVDYFKDDKTVVIDTLVCNNPSAGVLKKAVSWGCEVIQVDRESFRNSSDLAIKLGKRETDLVVLAGFLWLVPASLLEVFPNKIINIHPALLPKFGGKGMHGENVHKAVEIANEKESGITIHYINEEYDKGDVVFQAKCNVEGLNYKEIGQEVLKLEHAHFPEVIGKLLKE